MDQPLISIITIVKDHPKGLQHTGETLAAQDQQALGKVEWLVVNGSTKQDTGRVMDKFQPYIAWSCSEPDKGIYDAMNKGVEKATGKFLWFLNAGDILPDETVLHSVLSAINREHQADFIYGDHIHKDRLVHAFPLEDSGKRMPTSHQAMLFRNGPLRYDESYKLAADYKFVNEYLDTASHPVYLPQPLCRFEGGGLGERNFLQVAKESFRVRQEAKKVSLTENIGLTAITLVGGSLRTACPNLFKYMRAGYEMLLSKPDRETEPQIKRRSEKVALSPHQ
ncbi:MAG: glycosyl transferase family 2 [Alphaproteobacteria bacterium]|nr:glycosyl transferase family 2 [Alphaproteobacteria bacterium]